MVPPGFSAAGDGDEDDDDDAVPLLAGDCVAVLSSSPQPTVPSPTTPSPATAVDPKMRRRVQFARANEFPLRLEYDETIYRSPLLVCWTTEARDYLVDGENRASS